MHSLVHGSAPQCTHTLSPSCTPVHSLPLVSALDLCDTGCLVLKMTLDETGCSVQLMHEGGVFSLGPAIEYVVNSIKAAK